MKFLSLFVYYYRSQGGDDSANASSLNVSVGEDDTRNTEQLLELVRFLRREKEIAISRFEVMEAESQRLKTQLEQAGRQLTDAQVIPFCLIIFLFCTYNDN